MCGNKITLHQSLILIPISSLFQLLLLLLLLFPISGIFIHIVVIIRMDLWRTGATVVSWRVNNQEQLFVR